MLGDMALKSLHVLIDERQSCLWHCIPMLVQWLYKCLCILKQLIQNLIGVAEAGEAICDPLKHAVKRFLFSLCTAVKFLLELVVVKVL
jgi:hypothetical protein